MMSGGEVFILDMGKQMKVLDIAKRLIHLSGRSVSENSNSEGIEIIEVGLRDGEKMYEELLISGDEEKTINKKIFMSKEKFVSNEVFLELINSTKDAVAENDISKLTNLMEDYVDGFIYENKFLALLFLFHFSLHSYEANNLVVPNDFKASLFANNLEAPRQIAEGKKGYIFVGSKKGIVYALKDNDKNGQIDDVKIIFDGLNDSSGVAFSNGSLFIAEIDKVWRVDNIEDKLDSFSDKPLKKFWLQTISLLINGMVENGL